MKYRTIFSVVNEHTASTVTARYAIALAAAGGAELVLYSAHAEGTDEELLRHTDRHLDHLFTVAFDLDIHVTRITEAGPITRLLPERVQAENADLVFYPLTPHEQYGATLQRDNVHQLLRTIRPDLAIMRVVHMGRLHPRHILVPLGETISDMHKRLSFISALATAFHSSVTLFHRPGSNKMSAMPEDINHFKEGLHRHHIEILERSGNGHIGKSITVEAITRHNDLIVLGASERSTLRRLFIGNPAGDVMHKPPCNVVLFRASR